MKVIMQSDVSWRFLICSCAYKFWQWSCWYSILWFCSKDSYINYSLVSVSIMLLLQSLTKVYFHVMLSPPSERYGLGERALKKPSPWELGWAETDAEPRPVWVIVNTMNNFYSERLFSIDRPPSVCAPHLFLLRIHFPALMKRLRARQNLMRSVETF